MDTETKKPPTNEVSSIPLLEKLDNDMAKAAKEYDRRMKLGDRAGAAYHDGKRCYAMQFRQTITELSND